MNQERVLLVGGPNDGEELRVREVLSRIVLPDNHQPLSSHHVYDPVYVDGFPSRDDQGRLRYQYQGA